MSIQEEYSVYVHLLVYNKDELNYLRGEKSFTLPFVPSIGMHIAAKDRLPIIIRNVYWYPDESRFVCYAEDENRYRFDQDTDIKELTDILDILRDAKGDGWRGFEKIYKNK